MGQFAPRVHTDPDAIRLLEARAAGLPDEAIVEVELESGDKVLGTVSVRPVVQVFHDAEGREGINAMVRIDDAADPARPHYLWLDGIVDIRHLGTA